MKVDELRDENMRLAGHSNMSQKIRYLQTVKKDFGELQQVICLRIT